jgi:hypothetical protein
MSRHRAHARGQAMVEFAIVLPIFLAMLLGIVDFGRVIWATNSLSNAASEAARFAIVHGGSANDPCPVGPPGPDANIPAASASCPYPAPSKQAVKNVAIGYAIAGGSSVTATVCYGTGCSGDTDAASATDARGTPVTVVVTSNISLVAPALLGMGSFAITGRSTMLVNH